MKRNQKSLRKIKILMLLMLITLIFMLTATYAWVSTQRDVEITGMRINVEVAESMQISLNGEKWVQSIEITDMKQFYGTAGAGHQAVEISNTTTNQNYVPTELLPVSSAGELGSSGEKTGQLQFIRGEISGSSLINIEACSEADFTGTNKNATIETRESAEGAGNEKHPYFAFDLYLRNISANTENDTLRLDTGSMVYVNAGVIETPEGTGVANTGLEYSARVGFVRYGETVSINDTSTTIGEDIRTLEANDTVNSKTAQVAIWEPNNLHHTPYVVTNNNRVTETVMNTHVQTFPIKVAAATGNVATAKIDNTNVSTPTGNMVEVNTFKPTYTLPSNASGSWTGGVSEDDTASEGKGPKITDINGNEFGIEPNKISKVRVYIWLEGQDPDCVDLASTGDKLNIDLKLTKDATTMQPPTYIGNAPGGGPGMGAGGNGITAAQLYAMTDAEKTAIYGQTVTNYKPSNGASDNEATGTKWKIFHTDGSNIYLIADNYVERAYVPTGKGTDGNGLNGIPVGTGSAERGFSLVPCWDYQDVDSDGMVADIANSSVAVKWLKQYMDSTYKSVNTNMKATAYLLDTNMWKGFKDNTGYAEYSIGGPTLELFRDSYNVTHEQDIETQVSSMNGYQIRFKTVNNSNSYSDSISGLNQEESLYVIKDDTKAWGMWVASPFGRDTLSVMRVSYDGKVNSCSYSYAGCGARPCVVLKSSVQIEKQEDGTYILK